jgi:hypothetical protein
MHLPSAGAVHLDTGGDLSATEKGRIGSALQTLVIERTRLQQETAQVVRVLAVVAVGALLALLWLNAVRLLRRWLDSGTQKVAPTPARGRGTP